MPRIEAQATDGTTVASVGGSALYQRDNPHIDYEFIANFRKFCREQLDNNRVFVAVIGGGELARIRIGDAKACGVHTPKVLDTIGIYTTRSNAGIVGDILSETGVPIKTYSFYKPIEPGVVYLRGGNRIGHTSDYPTVEIAKREGVSVLLNIGAEAGLYPPTPDGGFDKTKPLIEEITIDDYLVLFPKDHDPGAHVPFERAAAELAKRANVTVVLLGPDFGNVRKCLAGEEFVGTVLRP
jgi:uridylate kinase